MDQNQRLQQIKARVETAKAKKAAAEGQLQALEQQNEQIVAEMTKLGVTPETISDEIDRLQHQINSDLDLADSLIPTDLV